MATLVSKVLRKAIRDVDNLNEGVARELERRLVGYTNLGTAVSAEDLGNINRIVDDVISPVYGADRVRAVQSDMFYAIAQNSRFMSNESFSEPFATLNAELYRAYPDRWPRLRDKMGAFQGGAPTVFADLGRGRMSSRQRILRRRLFDPNRRWVSPQGYRLSDRVWKSGLIHRRNIDRVLKRGIRRGDGPETIARSLRQYMSPKAAPLSYKGDRIFRKRAARGRFTDGQGASAARRLARTEVQRAAHAGTEEAVKIMREEIPRAAVQYSLSPAHPEVDICDEYASGSSRGYPRGVYTPDEVPQIPHPNCLCGRRPWVPSRAEVMQDLEERYGAPSQRVRRMGDEEWEYRGDGPYEWDASKFDDSVSWSSELRKYENDFDAETAYRLAYEDARSTHVAQRAEDLGDYFGHHYDDDGWPAVRVDGDSIHDLWYLEPDEIDELVMNSRSSIDFLMENMEDWDDLSPTIEISGKYSTGSAIADYGADSNTIRLNWHNRSWYGRDLPWDSGQLDDYSMRNLVGQSPQSHIVHEYGHTRHMTEMIRTGRLEWIEDPDDLGYFWEMRDPDGNFRQWGGDILSDGWLSNGERLTAHRVSTYAAENPSEFVAETHTALIMGESFPDDVMDLYRHLGGTVPSQSEMDAWAVATGREIDLDDDEMFFDIDVHGQDVFGDEYDDIARTLGLSRDEYDDMVNRGVQQLLISEEDMFDDMMLDVDFMRNIIDKLED